MSVPAPNRNYSTESVLIAVFSMAALLVHLLTNGRYGYFRDELYYIACARHLDFGYVDQPPLSILLLRLSQLLLGDSLFAIRLLPALAGAAIVALTGIIAREIGGRAWAIALACAGSLCALFNLAVGNFFSMNAFEPLFWMGCVYLLVRIINGGSPTLWLWFGVLLGIGIENKHSTVFFGVGIFVALLLTPERRHFAQKWIWLGGIIAFAIALPNILWQALHHWPTYELLSNIAHSNKNVALSPAQFIAQQAVFMNPGTLPLWLAGLFWLFGSRDGRRYRVIGIIYLVTLTEFIVLHGKSYYLAPAYPMLFAAGGVAVERVFAARLTMLDCSQRPPQRFVGRKIFEQKSVTAVSASVMTPRPQILSPDSNPLSLYADAHPRLGEHQSHRRLRHQSQCKISLQTLRLWFAARIRARLGSCTDAGKDRVPPARSCDCSRALPAIQHHPVATGEWCIARARAASITRD